MRLPFTKPHNTKPSFELLKLKFQQRQIRFAFWLGLAVRDVTSQQHSLENLNIWISFTLEVWITSIGSDHILLNGTLYALPENISFLIRHRLPAQKFIPEPF